MRKDYVITPYIAEFVNALTNAIYVIYGIHGLRRVRSHPSGSSYLSALSFPYWGLIGVGLLSAYFHATLKYHSQMGDDLSMFLAVGAILHQLLCFEASPSARRMYTLAILGTVLPISVYHVWADELLAHQVTFAAMILLVSRQARVLIRKQVGCEAQRARLGRLATFGLSMGLFGFFLWNIDVHLCGYVTAVKHWLGLPWGFVLELHAWWHIFTGIGSYVGMALVEFLVTMGQGQTGSLAEGFVWPVKAVMVELDGMDGSDGKKAQ